MDSEKMLASALRQNSTDFSSIEFSNIDIHLVADNQRENKAFQDVVVALKLSKSEAERLHREISKQGYNYHEILEIGIDMFGE